MGVKNGVDCCIHVPIIKKAQFQPYYIQLSYGLKKSIHVVIYPFFLSVPTYAQESPLLHTL